MKNVREDSRKYRVALVSNRAGAVALARALATRLDVDIAVDDSVAPDWERTLPMWDGEGCDAVVIDDEKIEDKEAMLAGIRRFSRSPRNPEARMRVVFLSAASRAYDDPVFARLVGDGVFDIVFPEKDASPVERVVQLITHPAKLSDVSTVAAPECSAVAKPKQPAPAKAEPVLVTRGRSVVAVVGTAPRSGCTNASIILARTLVLELGQPVALVTNDVTFAAFAKHYPSALLADGSAVVVNRVHIFRGVSAGAVPRSFAHVVLDLGYPGWGLERPDERQQEAKIQFHKADLQVIYMPFSNPREVEWSIKAFADLTPADVNRCAMATWGADDEIFEQVAQRIRRLAPDAYLWQMPPVMWPLSLSERIDGCVGALSPVLPKKRTRKTSAEGGAEPKGKGLFGRIFGKGEGDDGE